MFVTLAWLLVTIALVRSESYTAFLRPQFGVLLVIAAVILLLFLVVDFFDEEYRTETMLDFVKNIVILTPLLAIVMARGTTLGAEAFRLRAGAFINSTASLGSASQNDRNASGASSRGSATDTRYVPPALQLDLSSGPGASAGLVPSPDSEAPDDNKPRNASLAELSTFDFSKKPPHNPFEGKTVITEGKVFIPKGSKPGRFVVFRFLITCCAADAQPVGVVVESDTPAPPQDTWVSVRGRLTIDRTKNKPQGIPVIKDTSVNRKLPPDDEYLY